MKRLFFQHSPHVLGGSVPVVGGDLKSSGTKLGERLLLLLLLLFLLSLWGHAVVVVLPRNKRGGVESKESGHAKDSPRSATVCSFGKYFLYVPCSISAFSGYTFSVHSLFPGGQSLFSSSSAVFATLVHSLLSWFLPLHKRSQNRFRQC